ncbi:hypothetical protein H6G76_35080 [Nostoc sp. FACHB-152]|uniref:hypothetical protein n=1 Tax=Nostoc sp. FACHB-152 TaxID=2692837 RepID=UPI00168468CD|nr:hypothetical protein [Nostoc sp. FACHB-152]MBD2452235.1 hypothetical protein [Nostoc sp. FACHB-152]
MKNENIYVRTRYLVFLIFPYTLHPTPHTLPTQAFSFTRVPFGHRSFYPIDSDSYILADIFFFNKNIRKAILGKN